MYIAKNNARAQLTGILLIADTTANLEAGKGALFAVTAPEWTYITAFDGSGNIEHMKVTARATDALTIVRAQDGTAAREWPVGTYVECRPIAAAMADYAVAPQINGATAETSIADADEVGFVDASASNVLKKITWANVVATLKTYFDTLYRAATGNVTLAAGAAVVFEGATDDAHETTLTATDPTADRAITLPDKSGMLALLTDMPFTVQGFRLSLTTGLPVTTADVTGATTIYCAPYKGNQIALYDGSNWNIRSSAQFSLALGTLTSGKPYDVFCYDNGGVPTLEFTVWTNDTTRATALAYQDGVLVKSGTATRRYMGTFYTTSTTTTEDSDTKRYLWNYYHRVRRVLKKMEATASWVYTAAAWRQVQADTANQVNFVVGVAEDSVDCECRAYGTASGALTGVSMALALDSTSSPSGVYAAVGSASAQGGHVGGRYLGLVSAGRHYLAWLEYGGSGVVFYGAGGYIASGGVVGSVSA